MKRLQVELDETFRLELMGHNITDCGWAGFDHNHPFEEMLYVMKGKVRFCTDETTVQLEQGDLLLIPRDLTHRVASTDTSSFIYLGFRSNLVDLSPFMLRALPKDCTADMAMLCIQLEDMVHESFGEKTPLSRFSCRLMSLLIPALCSLEKERTRQDPRVVLSNKIKEYIKHNYNKPIRVDEIAAALYHTPHYLGNMFASFNGMTIKEYALSCKMQRAIAMLQEGNPSINELAAALGYDSAHYFSKCFKAYFGFLPSKLKHKD